MGQAVKAKQWLKGFWPAYTLDGTPPAIEWCVVANGSTVKPGDPVTMSSSVVTLGTITGQAFYGVALGGGTGDAGGTVKIPVALADGNTVFVAQGYGSSKHSSEVAIGTAYDVAGSTGAFKLNILGTTYKALKVVGLVPGDDAASEDEDTGGAVGRIYFLFNKSQFTGWKAVT